MRNLFLSFCLVLFITNIFAQRGKDGNGNITNPNTVVNEYTYLTVAATSGSTTISVAASSLNANGRFSSNLAAGDLLYIIQVQGVHVKGWMNTDVWQHARPMNDTYGRILDYESVGLNEYVQVLSVPNATSIELNCPLQNNYITAGDTTEVVIVRVPRYNTLIVSGSITCDTWNGQVGGIVAIEVLNDATINGNIDVSEKGFRGGEALLESLAWNIPQYGSPGINGTEEDGAEKGESIYGYRAEYNITKGGYYCRGAIANGGGGGNASNCGGGGGSNAGDTSAWTGQGNPSLAIPSWANAWNLEYVGFATSSSSGGGRGGYSYSGEDRDALTVAPGNTSWGGQNRVQYGGHGGRPLDYTTGRLYFGGGGGAGDQNDDEAGDGGDGGGLINMMVYGNISGSGTFNADGEIGGNAVGPAPGWGERTGIDGAGGGGGGGAIFISAIGTVSGVNATADGGDGGDQNLQIGAFSSDKVAEGPGGGGGGGYIAVSNSITTTVDGGQYGETNSGALTEFTPNGATSGADGIDNVIISNFEVSAASTLNICASDTAHLMAIITGTLPSGTSIGWYDASLGGSLLYTGANYDIPASSIVSGTTYYVGTCPGTYRVPVVVNVINVSATASADVEICEGDSTTISVVGSGSINWSHGPTSSSSTVSPSATTTYTVSISASGCTATDEVVVIFRNLPTVNANASSTSLCDGDPLILTGSGGASSYIWDNSVTNALSFNPSTSMMYHVTGTDGTCSNKDSVYVTVSPVPNVQANATDTIICLGDMLTLTGSGTASSYSWDNSVTNGVSFPPLVSAMYTVTGTLGGCTNIDSVFVNVVNSPTAFAGNDTSICMGDSLQITATGGGAYLWSTSSTNASITVGPSASITYTVTTSIGSCTATDDILVTVLPSPNVQANATDTIICLGDNLTLTGSGTAASYSWDNSVTNGVSFPPIVSATYTVTGTLGGCTSIDSVFVDVVNNPTAFAGNDTSICMGDSLQLTATGGGAYLWSTSSTNANITVSPTTNTTYTVTTSIGSCTATDDITITVLPIPNAQAGGDQTICLGDSVTLTATGGGTYIWSSGDASATTTVSPNATTTYYVTISNGTCDATDDVIITVSPIADATITATGPYCANEVAVQLLAVDIGGTWIGNGVNTSGLFDPSTVSIGTNQIIYTISGQCGDADTTDILIYDVPNITDSIIEESCIGANDGGIYINISGGNAPYSIVWSNGGVSDSITGLAPGTYSVIVSDQNLCEESINILLNGASNECFNNHIYIPNVFSPNGDLNNDFLDVNGAGIQRFEMKIFDRWGTKAFETTSIDNDWDGIYKNGEKAAVAVYTYYAKGTYTNGEKFTLKGNISLVK
jgi:gliding motility-associated-like protein